MDYDTATRIYQEIAQSSLHDLRKSLVNAAVEYARIRTDWQLASAEERRDLDQRRRIAHNALISACDILSRNMAKRGETIDWLVLLGDDRKNIGDFACYLHCLLGVKAG